MRKTPTAATIFGRDVFGRAVRIYQRNTRAKRGPRRPVSVHHRCVPEIDSLPEVIAMKNWNTERSGYRSPIVAETEGNHS